jgi:hypothetical protein
MIRAPDRFTFKTQLLSGLPSAMVSFIFDKGCSAEASSTRMILYYAREAEEIFRKKKRYQERRRLVETLTSSKDSTKPKPSAPSAKPECSLEGSREHNQDPRPPPDRSRFRERPKRRYSGDTTKDRRPPASGERSARYDPASSSKKSDDPKPPPTCFKCGGIGHYSTDKKCPENQGHAFAKPSKPNPGARMYAARDEHDGHEGCEPVKEETTPEGPDSPEGVRLAAAHSDPEDYEPDFIGSQYSSEGELYPLSSDYEPTRSDDEGSERFGAVRELPMGYESDYGTDDCPSMQSVSDSEDEDEDASISVQGEPLDSSLSQKLCNSEEEIGPIPCERLGVILDGPVPNNSNLRRPPALRKSSKKISRPARTERENRCYIVRMKIHGLEANVLLDSGCTSDSVSPEFTVAANLKVHELEEPVPLQLGTVGSRSKINFGLFSDFELDSLRGNHYFDVINIDRYDAIVGTVFMRKHGIVLDFERDEVRLQGRILNTILESKSTFRQVRRHAMRTQPVQDE